MSLTDPLSCLEKSSSYTAIAKAMEGGAGEFCINGLWGSSRSYLAASLRRRFPLPSLFIVSTIEEAEKTEDELKAISGDEIYLFPARETLPGEDIAPHPDIVSDRLQVLERLLSYNLKPSTLNFKPLVVAPLQALLNGVVSPAVLRSRLLRLTVGQTMNRDKLMKKLINYGYDHTSIVEERGNFSRRGGILDIYPSTGEYPLRLEFFADTIESIRPFSVTSQRSLERINAVTILPNGEHILRDKGKKLTTLLAYFSRDSLVFLDEPARLRAAGEQTQCRLPAKTLPSLSSFPINFDRILAACREKRLIRMSLLPQTIPEMKTVPAEHFPIQSLETYRGQFEELAKKIKEWKKDGYRIIFVCNNEGEKRRLKELLREREVKVGGKLSICLGRLQSGFLFPEIKLALIADQEIFGRYRLRRPRRRFKGGVPLSRFDDLQEGDYLVHVDQGIGRYLGVERIPSEGRERDFLTLEYLDKDKLYVPVEELHLVRKYTGVEGRAPRLSRLGGRSWERTKERVRKSIRDLASELLELHAAREARGGFAFSSDTPWQHEFEAAFIYEETPDQLRTLEEVKRDMETPEPMDRLICGDVGYGKTEVAIRAAFKCVMDGRQVAILVPTTILAQQHYTTFSDRMADYPINIAMLSRFQARSGQKEIIENLKKGTVDIVIGTHRLLQDDIAFKNLGLVIVDEEQRFGVAHKEKLKRLRKLVDILTLTATPIPRTLHMSLMGLKDMSQIDTPPEDRLPIQTLVTEYDEQTISAAIHREMSRDGQIFFVHNRVKGIERMAEKLRRIVPEARIAVAHGQMRERELEKVMSDFLNYKIDVLVVTTIIESGLDIPNVNTIIINRADAFGLSDLYQLRGRVGRFKHLAFAYLLFPKYSALSEVSRKRLKAIEEFSDLGSGFRIAMRDLQIRGAGNLLGPEQHGYIVEIGFDLYCQLLRQTVRELKGEKPKEEIDVHLDLGLEAYIPDDYVPDTRQRLSIYRKMVEITNEAGLKDLQEELQDRFGPLPPPAKRFLSLLALKLKSFRLGLTYLGRKGNLLTVKFRNNETMTLTLRPREKENLLQTIEKFLQVLK
ncbi:MAG: transcription-repair coupling factor [Nitrospirae bacterium]|nr:transcription-repair coupling factor [Nitrospirota bacterium]